jgi:hypothetical protein
MVLSARRALGSKPEDPSFILTHHKVATVLCRKVLMASTERIGWRYNSEMGVANEIASKTDLLHVIHGTTTDAFLDSGRRGVRIIRDPRDVIVSGFLYHQRCSELWCINSDFSKPGYHHPQVPLPLAHMDLETREAFVSSLEGVSYQERIRGFEQDDGLIFEMDGFARITIEEMVGWKERENVLTIKMEDMVADFDGSFEKMFRWIGIPDPSIPICLEIARGHDMNRMREDQIASNPHISTGKIRKWEEYFSSKVTAAYEERFGDAHLRLGYE